MIKKDLDFYKKTLNDYFKTSDLITSNSNILKETAKDYPITSNTLKKIFNSTNNEEIGINRKTLQDFSNFTSTYIHELGHKVTGKRDYDREFIDFFTNALAKIMSKQINPNYNLTQQQPHNGLFAGTNQI